MRDLCSGGISGVFWRSWHLTDRLLKPAKPRAKGKEKKHHVSGDERASSQGSQDAKEAKDLALGKAKKPRD